ncbi:MAG TPA: hypothetical protein VI688_02930 [Anaerolineales bacterium]|nr:hypothetical protein [Anaerolineales bacterium]
MAGLTQTALADLLRRTQSAHHEHQVNDLGGKYNEEWAQWYAEFLIDNGIADFLASPPKHANLAGFLDQGYRAFEAGGLPGDWADFIAGQLLEHHDLIFPPPTTPEKDTDGDQSEEGQSEEDSQSQEDDQSESQTP